MQIIRDLVSLRTAVFSLKTSSSPQGQGGGHIALVPTMGALHDGHLSLVRAAKAHADHVIVSIFVNPIQFGPNEDLDAYPRQEAQDAALLESEGVSILWAPTVSEMYPTGFATNISVGGVSEGLCGASRPGHFDGVATVVTKLLNQVQPDVALFGEKDYQQLAVIRRFVADLNLPAQIIGVPIARAADGLALSSRNAYLSVEEREQAPALYQAMQNAARQITSGMNITETLDTLKQQLLNSGFASVEYAELRDAESLSPIADITKEGRLLVAARLGKTRLIDNIAVKTK
ncbi:MAG: pantoate--beta-alanine ligase [Sphingobium sp.]|nr:pantoate--beta-alanine ligase [Sphingobium sp.]